MFLKLNDVINFFMPRMALDSLFGGGGGGSQPATQTVTQQNAVSAFAAPYVENMLGKAEALTSQPYQTYPGQRTADFTGLQNQAFSGAQNLGVMGQTQEATNLAGQAGLGALNTQYQAGQFGNQFQAPQDYQANRFSADRIGTQSFAQPGTADSFMSPYMQNVVDAQQREARRASQIAGQGQQAEAVGRGAFGGSRDALMRAERERNLNTQLGDIQSAGLNAAYNQAMQQFNAEQQARLAAQQANQQAGLSAQQMSEQSRQFGAGQGLQSASLGAQYGQAANQLAEQSRQYGAGLGIQGLQTALQGANILGQLGQNQYAQQTGNIGLQNQLGTQQQQQQQNILNQQYQDFLTQKQNPYNQLSFMQSMLSGLPIQSSTQNVYSNPSMVSQVAGLGTTALAGAKLAGYAKGGKVGSGIDHLGMYNATK